LGIVLFVFAMFYIPMAQVHQAVVNDYRAFFDFRFVWQLIRSRLTAYVALAGLFAVLGVVVEGLKTAPVFFDGYNPAWTDLDDRAFRRALEGYYLWCGLYLFLFLLLTRRLAVSVYCSAVLKALRRGRVLREDLHPALRTWLDRLGLLPAVRPPDQGFVLAARRTGRTAYRAVLWTLLYFIWLGFAVKTYVGEFLNYHPVVGFMNHPLIQFPAFDYVPADLGKPTPPPEGGPQPPGDAADS
jgi:hypothetical protein